MGGDRARRNRLCPLTRGRPCTHALVRLRPEVSLRVAPPPPLASRLANGNLDTGGKATRPLPPLLAGPFFAQEPRNCSSISEGQIFQQRAQYTWPTGKGQDEHVTRRSKDSTRTERGPAPLFLGGGLTIQSQWREGVS
ncbi:uncharacterized protein ACOB8E_007923 [Sarcophilus harrisii]